MILQPKTSYFEIKTIIPTDSLGRVSIRTDIEDGDLVESFDINSLRVIQGIKPDNKSTRFQYLTEEERAN